MVQKWQNPKCFVTSVPWYLNSFTMSLKCNVLWIKRKLVIYPNYIYFISLNKNTYQWYTWDNILMTIMITFPPKFKPSPLHIYLFSYLVERSVFHPLHICSNQLRQTLVVWTDLTLLFLISVFLIQNRSQIASNFNTNCHPKHSNVSKSLVSSQDLTSLVLLRSSFFFLIDLMLL